MQAQQGPAIPPGQAFPLQPLQPTEQQRPQRPHSSSQQMFAQSQQQHPALFQQQLAQQWQQQLNQRAAGGQPPANFPAPGQPGAQQMPPREASGRGLPVVGHASTIAEIQSRYQIGDVIGVGGYAVVKKATDLVTGEQVAIKIVEKSRYAMTDESLEREIRVLSMIDHPNCIKLHAVYYTIRNVYIVTEFVRGGELLDRISETGNYHEDVAGRLVGDILSGVAYLHSMGIVHRDLKLENLVLVDDSEDSQVKIADFGLSKMLDTVSLMKTICGSPQYVAPEVLNVGEVLSDYTPAVDMWSVGVVLFILLSGYSPFDEDDETVLYDKIRKGLYDIDDPIWDSVSFEAKDLVAKLLTVDVSLRLSAREALNHPFVQRSMRGRGGPGGSSSMMTG